VNEWFEFGWIGAECARCSDSATCGGGCEQWGSIPFDRIGGFLFEPGSSGGLVRFPPEKLILALVAAIESEGGLILVNEVTTGIGRTGRWFGFEHYGIRPHIVAMGKGIGNGYPVSVAAFRADVIERLEGRAIPYAQSHQNDPLGAAVAREVIRTIREEGLIEKSQETAVRLVEGLEGIRTHTDRILAIRARGLMVAVEVKDDSEPSFTAHVFLELLRRGFIVARRAGLNVLRIDPPLTIGAAEIDAFLEAFEEVLAA
jgi:acetylornithine aminotransferase